MKMQMDHGTVLDNLSNSARVMTYRIDEEDTGMVMDIIANRTYSKKQLAVVREYICNAYDAHVEAGKLDTPFDVTLPTSMEPVFKVRDYGLGLSVEDIERIYVRVAKSTKRNSNSVIGAYGIGSKSAFCYGDSFIVTSWNDGVCSRYVAQINAQKQARMLHLSSEPSNEPSGVEIQVSVNQADIKIFKDHIFEVCENFPVLPKIINSVEPIEKPKVFLNGTGWHIRGEGFIRNWNKSRVDALCGNVKYSVDLEAAGITYDKLPSVDNIVFEFALGEVDIPPSRENLEYTLKTIEAVKNKLAMFNNELRSLIQKKIDSCSNISDAIECLPDFNSYQFLYNGINLRSITSFTNKEVGAIIYSRNGDWQFTRKNGRQYLGIINKSTCVVLDDAPRLASRLNSLPRELTKAIVISSEEQKKMIGFDFWPSDRKFLASNLTAPKIQRRSGGPLAIDVDNYFNIITYRDLDAIQLQGTTTIESGKKFYFEMKGRNLIDTMHKDQFNLIKSMFLGDTPVYAVRQKIVKSLDKDWVNAMDYVTRKIMDLFASITEQDVKDLSESVNSRSNNFPFDFLKDGEAHEINKIIENRKRLSILAERVGKLSAFLFNNGHNIANPFAHAYSMQSQCSVKDKIEKFYAKYPMLRLLASQFQYSLSMKESIDKAVISDIMYYINSKN